MMDPCVTSCGLTLKVRAIHELAAPYLVETGFKQVYEGRRVRPGEFGERRARLSTRLCIPDWTFHKEQKSWLMVC